MSDGWESVRLSEIEPVEVAGLQWLPLRKTLGVEAFGINAYVASAAGDHVLEDHTESHLGHQEVYFVAAGRATFTLDGETLDAPAGTAVFISNTEIRRGAIAEEPGTTVLAIGAKAGEAYTPSAWEWSFYAERFRPTEDWDGAIAHLERGLERFPDNESVLYALGCYEALDGRPEAALAHVQRAAELNPSNATWAQTDKDLASIRELPGFPSA
jgi:tetratricopeptide (TPR) repeat protein